MNNLLKSAVRKHALKNGEATAKWDDAQFELYAKVHGITERDNLKKANHAKTATAKKVEEKPEVKSVGKIDQAIAELIKATAANSELDEGRVVELINEHSKAPKLTSVEIKHIDKPTVTRDGVHKEYATVLSHIAAGVHTAVVGPAGSGKSTIFQQIAEDLGVDYYTTGAVQQESKVMGYNDAHGKYVRTSFREAYENGGLHVFEEFDGSAPKALLAANNAIANEITDFPDGMVKRHPDFVCVMAGNTYGVGASRQYVGRSQLDGATLDRFAFIEVDYDEALERAVALSFNSEASSWVDRVQGFRAKVRAAGIRHIVSPRASIMGAKLLAQGLSVAVITKSVLHKGLSQDQIAQLS